MARARRGIGKCYRQLFFCIENRQNGQNDRMRTEINKNIVLFHFICYYMGGGVCHEAAASES